MDYYNFKKKRSILDSVSINILFITLNIFLFFLITLLIEFNLISLNNIALKPSDIFAGKSLWTFLTSMFMHAGVAHLFFNMFSLFFIGKFLEKIIGKKRFLWFYLTSGLFAGLFFVLLSGFFGTSLLGVKIFGDPTIAGVGASGAIFGLVGLLAMLIPFSRVYLILGPLIAIIIDSISPAIIASPSILNVVSVIVNIYLFISIFAIFSFNPKTKKWAIPVEMPLWVLPIVAIVPLVIIGLFFPLPIGNTAHLGGLFAGLIYGFYLKRKYPSKTRRISQLFS